MDLSKIYEFHPDEIVDRPGIPRKRHDMGKIQELADSIKQYGQFVPALITDNKELIAGGRRRDACKLAGVPFKCVFRSQVSDLELRELELEENIRRKDLEWHESAALIKEITELKQAIQGKGGPGKDYGWSNQSTADLMGISRGAVSQAISLASAIEEMPQLKEAKTADDARKLLAKMEEQAILTVLAQRAKEFAPEANDICEAGFIIKDAFVGLKDLAAGTADFADVDTPYGIDLNDNKKTAQTSDALKTTSRYTEWSRDTYLANMMVVGQEVHRILKSNGWALFWFGIEWYSPLLEVLRMSGFEVDIIPGIWYGGAGGAQTMNPQVNLGRSYDTFFICRKGQPALARPGRANVFCFDKLHPSKKIHPTEKPLALMEEIVSVFTHPGAHGLVPFHGSGNTLRALLKHGCTGVGFELDEQLKLKCMMRIEDDKRQPIEGATE